jgi:hypothetical protein
MTLEELRALMAERFPDRVTWISCDVWNRRRGTSQSWAAGVFDPTGERVERHVSAESAEGLLPLISAIEGEPTHGPFPAE